MKHFIDRIVCTLLVSLAIIVTSVQAGEYGTITFTNDRGNFCSTELHSGRTLLGLGAWNAPSCSGVFNTSLLDIQDVPSSTRIWLVRTDYQNGINRCIDGSFPDGYTTELLTVKKRTTLETPIALGDIKTLVPGAVVKPGVRLINDTFPATTGVGCIIADVSELAEPVALADETAKLTLEGYNGENHCSLNFENASYNFKDNQHCKNNKAVAIEFEHVPSASNIRLFDNECDGQWTGLGWVILRTTKENLSVSGITLNKILQTPRGNIVAPGVLVVDYKYAGGNGLNEEISCVKIEVDAPAPPVSP